MDLHSQQTESTALYTGDLLYQHKTEGPVVAIMKAKGR